MSVADPGDPPGVPVLHGAEGRRSLSPGNCGYASIRVFNFANDCCSIKSNYYCRVFYYHGMLQVCYAA